MVNKSPFQLYNDYMDTTSTYTKRFKKLRWKLTLSYTGVTVGALLTVELILLVSTAIVVAVLLNSGVLQVDLIKATSDAYTPQLQFLLSRTPPDQDEITNFLDRMGALTTSTIPLTFMLPTNCLLLGMMVFYLGADFRTNLKMT